MELDDIARNALAAREFQIATGHAHYTLRLPTRYEITLAASRAQASADEPGAKDPAHLLILERLLLERAVVRWTGVHVRDVLPEHEAADEPLPFEPRAVPLLLDAQPDLARDLSLALFDRMAQRREAGDTAAKN
jgi:hypothetical protein